MTTNLQKQQWYFLQFQNYKKQKNRINTDIKQKYLKLKKEKLLISKQVKKMFGKYLLEIKKLNLIINQNQIAIKNLSVKLNTIDLFINKQQLITSSLNNEQDCKKNH